jgi:spermidine synthase
LVTAGRAAGGLGGADQITTLAEDRFYQDRIVFSTTSPYQRIVVTQGRAAAPAVPQRQPAVCRARRIPLPRGAGAPRHGRHGAPRKVAVLGGGDGMAVREVLKYPTVEQVTLVELDPAMTGCFATTPALAAAERRCAALAQGASSTPTPSPGWKQTRTRST